MTRYFLQLATILIFILSCLSLNAATIKGRIVNSNNGEGISNATIKVINQKYFAISDAQGNYVLQNLPAGKYFAIAKSIGYEESAQELIVKNSNEIITYNFSLNSNNTSIQEVVISGKSNVSDASARFSERKADNIINVVSAKTIELSPDLTVANVIQRVSGVTLERNNSGDGQYALLRGMDKRFNYTMVNGIKIPSPDNKNRFVPLDIFPSELLDRLEVTKALTSDMEGDGIGGAVNMVMKDAPAVRQFTANVATGYNALFFNNSYQSFNISAVDRKSPNEKYGLAYPVQMKDFTQKNLHLNSGTAMPNLSGGFSYGDRILKEKLGIILAGSYQNSIRGNTSDMYGTNTESDGSQNITRRDLSNHQTRLGLHAMLDMKLSQNHKLMWYNAYMDFGNSQIRYANNFSSLSARFRSNHQSIMNSTLKGVDSFIGNKLNIDWSLSYGKASNETPDNVQVNAFVINGITSVDQNTGATHSWEHNSDKDNAGYLNLVYRIELKNRASLDLSTGGMYRDKVRESYFNEYIFKPFDAAKANPRELIKGIDWNNFDEIKFSVASFGNLSDPLNYGATEKIGAGYLQGKLSLSKLQIITGVRAEHTNQGYTLQFTTEGARNEGNQEYVDFLPNINLKFLVNPKTNLRLSYTKAINRPSFFEIVPYSRIYEDYKEHGNPDLKHTVAHNFDLRYEYFTPSAEQFMVGLFYKKIKDPIEFGMMSGFGQDMYYMPMNFGDAKNYGIEFDMIKYFNWIGIKANYTLTNSRITTPKMREIPNPDPNAETNIITEYVNQTRSLFGQASNVVNLSLLFQDKQNGWSGQLALSYTGDRLCIVSRYLDEDSWQAGYTQLDASVEKKLKMGLTLFAKASNLLDAPMLQYIKWNEKNALYVNVERYEGGIISRKEHYGQNILIGLRYKFH